MCSETSKRYKSLRSVTAVTNLELFTSLSSLDWNSLKDLKIGRDIQLFFPPLLFRCLICVKLWHASTKYLVRLSSGMIVTGSHVPFRISPCNSWNLSPYAHLKLTGKSYCLRSKFVLVNHEKEPQKWQSSMPSLWKMAEFQPFLF